MLIRKQLILLSIMAIMGVSAFPQETALTNPLPMDPTVRTGRLSNGLTYYLRQNPKPEKRLLLQLAVNAGSVNENDSQQGLAHFVEHMCFNGTKTWKGNDLINMLESMEYVLAMDSTPIPVLIRQSISLKFRQITRII
jgi:zinc protease